MKNDVAPSSADLVCMDFSQTRLLLHLGHATTPSATVVFAIFHTLTASSGGIPCIILLMARAKGAPDCRIKDSMCVSICLPVSCPHQHESP